MAHILLHLLGIERIALQRRALEGPLAEALKEDLEYARLGAAFADLPRFDRPAWSVARHALGLPPPAAPFFDLYHRIAPVAFGLKVAELVAAGALVGREPGLAFVAGWFTHVALDRALAPTVARCAVREARRGESAARARDRVEWLQLGFWIRETAGRDLVGGPEIARRTRVVKRRALPVGGVGKGFYEIVRLASTEVIGAAPRKDEVDRWVRGLYLYGRALASPLARKLAPPADAALSRRLYRGDEIDVFSRVEEGLASAEETLRRVHELIERGDFSGKTRARFLSHLPEGPLLEAAA